MWVEKDRLGGQNGGLPERQRCLNVVVVEGGGDIVKSKAVNPQDVVVKGKRTNGNIIKTDNLI